jgi:MFS transporter, ACDE family, multidrug resistance protein
VAIAVTLAVMAVATDTKAVLATCVVVAGLFIGIDNTLITQTVMKAARRPRWRRRPTALRGSLLRRWPRGWPALGERISVHVPFWVGAVTVLVGAAALAASRRYLAGVDAAEGELDEITDEATAVTIGSDACD